MAAGIYFTSAKLAIRQAGPGLTFHFARALESDRRARDTALGGGGGVHGLQLALYDDRSGLAEIPIAGV